MKSLKRQQNLLACCSKLDPGLRWVRPKSEIQDYESTQQRKRLSSVDLRSCFLPNDLLEAVGAIPKEISVLFLRSNKKGKIAAVCYEITYDTV